MFDEGDTIIDGGNSKWTDSVDRHAKCAERGVHFVDVGTSGGIWGLEIGYCMMVGGEDEAVKRLEPLFNVAGPAGHRQGCRSAGATWAAPARATS